MQQVGVGGTLANTPCHDCGVRPGASARAAELVPPAPRETLVRKKKIRFFFLFSSANSWLKAQHKATL